MVTFEIKLQKYFEIFLKLFHCFKTRVITSETKIKSFQSLEEL